MVSLCSRLLVRSQRPSVLKISGECGLVPLDSKAAIGSTRILQCGTEEPLTFSFLRALFQLAEVSSQGLSFLRSLTAFDFNDYPAEVSSAPTSPIFFWLWLYSKTALFSSMVSEKDVEQTLLPLL
ncbi:hypothetical protein J6590_021081 [Homalodisca vitripennis]|nr:hypothetical protein J6590_021081 [Homalodisca vitripennis]